MNHQQLEEKLKDLDQKRKEIIKQIEEETLKVIEENYTHVEYKFYYSLGDVSYIPKEDFLNPKYYEKEKNVGEETSFDHLEWFADNIDKKRFLNNYRKSTYDNFYGAKKVIRGEKDNI